MIENVRNVLIGLKCRVLTNVDRTMSKIYGEEVKK